jgi:peptidoglycan/xylan/chitin deacetylase (PgdA/CDA1 family)
MLRLPLLFRIPNKLRRRARRNRIMALVIALSLLLLPFLTCLYVVYRPPALVVRYMMGRFPDVLWHVDTRRKIVALTLDDAPSRHTPDIMRVLRENDAHATLFVIGAQAQGHEREAVLRDAVLAGHELGNHAWRDEGSNALATEQLRAEIVGVKAVIRQAYAAADDAPPPPNYFRPGGGFFSARMRALADRLGYRIVLGDVYPHDPQMPWPKLNAWHVLSMVRPGSIIICHDRRSWTVPMLEAVLPELRRRGYEIVTISGLLAAAEEEAKEAEAAGRED